MTRAHFISRYAYLVAVNPDLTPKWDASLRDRMNDGCGVPHAQGGQLEPNGQPEGCRVGANYGVDPAVNRPGGGRVLDDSSSSPTVAPDGSIYYGAYSSYNYFQGHLMHFDATGNYLNAYEFGWDTTPAIYLHDGTYSLITKDNHYGDSGSYCSDETFCPSDRNTYAPDYPEQYFISQLSPNLAVEWQFASNNTESCSRDASGNVTCVSDHPNFFEWCVNAPAVDANGTVFVNSEDGWLYSIAQGGTVNDRIFQQLALGAAYTPASLGTDGKIYSQNSGHLFVIGQ
jgi:outer membrane protein assembly factor BamB